MTKNLSPLLNFAHDGKEFHKAVQKRLTDMKCSMNRLSIESAISWSTMTRWAKGSKPDIDTVNLVEQTLRKLERESGTRKS